MVIGGLISLVIGGLLLYWSISGGMLILPGVFGCMGLIIGVGCLGVAIKDANNKSKQKKLDKQLEKERIQKTNAINSSVEKGTWKFPVLLFYNECKLVNVSSFSDEYSIKKGKQICQKILENNLVSEQHYSKYFDDMQSLYNSGKEQFEYEKNQERLKIEKWNNTPQKCDLSDEQKNIVNHFDSLINCVDTEKRIKMLNKLALEIKEKIEQKERAAESARILGEAIATSAYQEKKADWAIMGGIASGIAGPGAGAAVAIDTMNKNAEIDARNNQNKAAAFKMGMDVWDLSDKALNDVSKLKEKLNNTYELIDETREKIVLDNPRNEELFNYLNVNSKSVQKQSNNALKITLSINNAYKPDVPDAVTMVVDGMLKATIYSEEKYIGEVNIALPTFGLDCINRTVNLTTYCDTYLPKNTSYDVKVECRNLWVMEL